MEHIKESLKSEHEKLKIYSAFFAGLVASLGSILLKGDFSTLPLLVLAVASSFSIAILLSIVICFVEIRSLLNLLKTKEKS